jgi:hypothetical protein
VIQVLISLKHPLSFSLWLYFFFTLLEEACS